MEAHACALLELSKLLICEIASNIIRRAENVMTSTKTTN